MSDQDKETVQSAANAAAEVSWERALIEKVMMANLTEQRRARRWNLFFRFLMVGLVVLLLLSSLPALWSDPTLSGKRFTALIDVQGVISQESAASADIIVSGLRAAFEHDNTAGVILRINSPGGSPVQSGYINDEIYRLKEAHPDIPVYAVIQDMCASGGYYIASAADDIYADKASLVGSIGVVMDGFGFVDGMQKLGIDRRLYTAGEHKGFLDPFSPSDPAEVEHISTLLNEIHQQFINTVLKGRRDRLSSDADLFSGYVWTGEQGLELGLVDGLGSSSYVAREIIGAEEIVNFTPRRNYLDRLAERMGAGVSAFMRSNTGLILR
ncbi:MAG: S49 family peptidase [Gammaproteobacteria bacterium]|nr:S49 family peptidase [Gammaproteobacteria bacterium]